MKQSNLLFMSAAMMLASCGGTKEAGQNGALIERSDIKIEGQRMTPEALWAMGRIGSVAVSPDEKQIAYSVAYYSVPTAAITSKLLVTIGRKASLPGLRTARKSLSCAMKAVAAKYGK